MGQTGLGLAAASASFSLGWDEAEFGKLIEWVGKVQGGLEGDSRKIVRVFFWESVENEDTKASWLSYIIRTLSSSSSIISMETQARERLQPFHDGTQHQVAWGSPI